MVAVQLVLLTANWNRPLLALAMICFTVIVVSLFVHGPKWFKDN